MTGTQANGTPSSQTGNMRAAVRSPLGWRMDAGYEASVGEALAAAA
jgi:hypothetical protein